MSRIFVCLAISNLLLLALAGGWGWVSPDVAPDRHVLLGVMALIFSALLQTIAFTYFTVTGKMIRWVLRSGPGDPEPLRDIERFKLRMTRCLAVVAAVVVAVTATGASRWRTGGGGTWHLLTACLATIVHGVVLLREFRLIVRNSALLARTIDRRGDTRSVPAAASPPAETPSCLSSH